MKGWFYMVNMKSLGLTAQSVVAGQLGSISCFLEAARAVGVNLLTNLTSKDFVPIASASSLLTFLYTI